MLWGEFNYFPRSVPPFLAPSAGGAVWKCPGTALGVRRKAGVSRAGWSSRGTTAGAGLGAPGASSGALG